MEELEKNHNLIMKKKIARIENLKDQMNKLSADFSDKLSKIQKELSDRTAKISNEWEHNPCEHIKTFTEKINEELIAKGDLEDQK
ncbi:MAG: hypothetical protein MJ252_17620 [archaeon]|nr:hypothetical protein [archaeon]